MDRKFIEKFGVDLPRLGYGCMRLPTVNNKIDFEKAKELIHHAYDNGLNYFDTAYNYHNYGSEKFLGSVLPDFPRESYYLTTKLPIWKVESEEDAERLFNEQLENCNTEYFDFYLLHAMSSKRKEIMDKFNLYDFLSKKKKEGKVRNIGFSFHDTKDVLEQLASQHEWDFVQLQINYWDYSENDAKDLYDILVKYNLPCFVMEPVRGGFLAELAPKVSKLMKDYTPENSIASWALRWVASLPNVALILSGMTNMEQLDDNLNTFTNIKPVNEDELKIIGNVVDELRKIKPVPCTGCRYCMDCSFGVDIPKVFEIYNNYKRTENKQLTIKNYELLKEENRADKCQKCKVCMTKCPQGIQIPDELEKINKEILQLMQN